MKPTIEAIRKADASGDKDLFERLLTIRQSRFSRYAPRIKPATSQRQRRRDHRRTRPHVWKGGAR